MNIPTRPPFYQFPSQRRVNMGESAQSASRTSCTGPKGVLADFEDQFRSETMAYTQFNEFDDENGTLVGGSSRRPSARPSLVPTIGFNDFVPQIDDEAPSTSIVIHVFEPSLSLCHQTDAHLETLSLKYPDIKFLRIPAEEVGEVMYFDPVALPALLVYQGGGELTHCLLRMNEEVQEWHLNGSCSTAVFESYLLQNDVLY